MPKVAKPDNDLDRIKALVEGATALHWTVVPSEGGPDAAPFYRVMRANSTEVMRTWRKEDAEFVVAARADIPELIAELRWLRAWAQDAEDLLAIYDRSDEPTITYEEAIKKLER